jgi:tripartite-type tricarboxylate transporter receptor subunit TctC
MLTTRLVAWIIPVGLMVLGASAVSGQTYPSKPIRILTSAVGGSSDFASRQIAQGITESLGQPIIVDNRGNISGELAAKAAPDGYTLLLDGFSFWIAPLVQAMPYDPVRDFSAITLISTAPTILVVHPSVPVKSAEELIALAKAKPGELNYASSGAGSSQHLAVELFKAMAGVNIVHVPYKGGATLMIALIGGEVQLAFASTAMAAPHINSNRLRALAVTSAQPTALFPGLPTLAASGVPGYEFTATVALFAPAKTPEAIIDRLSRETVLFLNRAEVKKRFFNNGAETLGTSPAELAASVKSDLAKWGKVIKDAGIRAD